MTEQEFYDNLVVLAEIQVKIMDIRNICDSIEWQCHIKCLDKTFESAVEIEDLTKEIRDIVSCKTKYENK